MDDSKSEKIVENLLGKRYKKKNRYRPNSYDRERDDIDEDDDSKDFGTGETVGNYRGRRKRKLQIITGGKGKIYW